MARRKTGRKECFVFIQVLIVLVLSTQCVAMVTYGRINAHANESFADNPAPSAVTNTHSELGSDDDDAENSAGESGEDDDADANAITRQQPGDMTDAKWRGMDMTQKIAFWNGQSEKEINSACTTLKEVIIPLARKKNIDEVRLKDLEKYVNTWKETGARIKDGELNEKFKLVRTDMEKIKSRQTPVIQQKAERGLAAVNAIGQGVKKIKDNWGVEGKEWEMISDLSTMLSGVLAVIPTPYTKALAVFLDVVSSLIGIFSPSTQLSVTDYISKTVVDIKKRFNQENFVDSTANFYNLESFWTFITTIVKGPISKDEWDNYMRSNSIPAANVHIKSTVKASLWVTLNLANGEDGDNTAKIMVQYYRMCKIVDQMYTRIIQLMPHDDTSQSNIREFYRRTKDNLRKDAYDFTMKQVLVINRHSAITLRHFYPPGINKDSEEVFEYINGLTYMTGNDKEIEGEVTGVTGIPQVPKGEFYLESSQWTGWYVTLASDWDGYVEKVQERKMVFKFGCGQCNIGSPLMNQWHFEESTPYDLGVMITLRQNTKHTIKIDPSSDMLETISTMTFTKDNGEIKYLTSFQPTRTRQRNTRYEAIPPRRTDEVPIFAPTASKSTSGHRGIITNGNWRIIPLEKEKGDSGIPVMIGDADGTSFLIVHDEYAYGYQSPIYLKPLEPEKDGDDKHRVNKKNIFYLHQVEGKKNE